MIANPDEAARLAAKRAIDGTDPAVNLEIIRVRNAASVSPATDKHGLGVFDMASLQKAADAYRKLGLVQRDIKVSDVVSQDLLPGKEPKP
jgi:NitT/TauT family transport system substrate-binding protein